MLICLAAARSKVRGAVQRQDDRIREQHVVTVEILGDVAHMLSDFRALNAAVQREQFLRINSVKPLPRGRLPFIHS